MTLTWVILGVAAAVLVLIAVYVGTWRTEPRQPAPKEPDSAE